MRCPDLELRLFDEDCRAALFDGQPMPADVATHLASCERCRVAWDAGADEAHQWHTALRQPLPADLRTTLYHIPLGERTSLAWMARLLRVANALSDGVIVTIVASSVFSMSQASKTATLAVVVMVALALDSARDLGLVPQVRPLLWLARSLPSVVGFRDLASRRGW